MKRIILSFAAGVTILFVHSLSASVASPTDRTLTQALQKETPEQQQDANANKALPLGQQLFNRGDFIGAIKLWRTQANGFRNSGDQENLVIMLYQIARAQRALGLDERAVKGLTVALEMAQKSELKSLIPMIEANLGGAYVSLGNITAARKWLHEARVNALLDEQEIIEATVLDEMGNAYAYSADYQHAIDHYRRAATLAETLGRPLIAARAQTNAIAAALHLNQYDQVALLLATAAQHLADLNHAYDVTIASIALGEVTAKALQQQPAGYDGVISAVGVLLNQSLQFAVSVENPWLASQSLGTLAGLYQTAGQYENAIILNNKALIYAQQIEAPELLYRWERQAGQIYAAMHHMEESIRAYRLAVNSLQPLRQQLSRESIGKHTSFMDAQGGVYLELADLLLQKSDTVSEQKKISAYLLEARDTVEMQKEAELQDYFKDQCVTDIKQQVKNIDDSIASDTVVLYPILLPDRTELLVSSSAGIKRYTVKVGYEELTDNVRSLRVKLEKHTTRQYLPYAKNLYQWLIAPMEVDLKAHNITTIVVVAGQSLRTIPMAVLHDGNEFLINKYALATTPGLKLTDSRPLKRSNMKILLTGLTDPVQGFPPLQHVRGELEEIHDLYVSKLLMNRAFVTQSVYDSLNDTDYQITHIASHSMFTGDIQDSYILTYDSKITVNQLGRFATLGNNRNKPIELLTLSACQTAAGDDRAALGLAGVAVKSGARSALATLWSINDQASSILVTEFYRQLLDEKLSKAQALQNAQAKLMQDVRYRHPGYWSPFLLIGNWL